MIYCLSVGCAVLAIMTGNKKIHLSVWRVVLLCQFLVLVGNLHFFVVAGNFDYDRKKKRYSRLLVGNWQFFVVAGNFHYDRKKKRFITTGKKRYSRLSDGCAVLAITTRKKKDTVVGLLGARFWGLRPEKKRYSPLSGGLCCCIVFCSGGKF